MNNLIRLILNTVAILIAAYLLPGVAVSGFLAALVVAVVLAIINIFVKPILVILTLPITVVTFGLFLLVINAILIQLASAIVQGFDVKNFWWALLFSLVLSLLNSVLQSSPKIGNPPSQTTFIK